MLLHDNTAFLNPYLTYSLEFSSAPGEKHSYSKIDDLQTVTISMFTENSN